MPARLPALHRSLRHSNHLGNRIGARSHHSISTQPQRSSGKKKKKQEVDGTSLARPRQKSGSWELECKAKDGLDIILPLSPGGICERRWLMSTEIGEVKRKTPSRKHPRSVSGFLLLPRPRPPPLPSSARPDSAASINHCCIGCLDPGSEIAFVSVSEKCGVGRGINHQTFERNLSEMDGRHGLEL